jgi:adenine-specific DNA-methyltransferase
MELAATGMVAPGRPLVTPISKMSSETAAILAAVPQWWQSKALQAGLSGDWLKVDHALATTPPADLPAVDPSTKVSGSMSAQELGQSYVESMSSKTRSENGRHYTPAVLSERLWAMARNALGWGVDPVSLPGLVRDPACGAGSLLLPVIREHLAANSDTEAALVISGLAARIQGVDLDEHAVYLANVILGAEALPTLARVPEPRRRPIPQMAIIGDGLAERETALVTIVNPPYGRMRLSAEDRNRFADVLFGHANLYSLFMAAGAANLAEKGVLAALVPTSFTSGLYFHKLRHFLASSASLESVTFVEDRSGVFAGVLQETCLAVFSRRRNRRVRVSRSNGSVVEVAVTPVPKKGGPWLIPREAADAAIAAAAAKLPLTLEAAGWHASTGPLVWNRRKSDLSSRPSNIRTRVLWAADFEDGVIGRHRSRDALRYLTTHGLQDEKTMILCEDAVLVQRTTAPEQTRRLIAADLSPSTLALLGGRVVVENHVNVLRPTMAAPLLDRATLARVLHTTTMDRLMRCISGSVAVSSYELGSLPLPAAEILASWRALADADLEAAVAAAYQPVTPS